MFNSHIFIDRGFIQMASQMTKTLSV